MRHIMRIQCLVFDLDDTLVSDLENKRGAWEYLMNFLNLPYSDEEFLRWNAFDHNFWVNGSYKKIKIPMPFSKTKEGFTEYVRSMRFVYFFETTFGHSPFLLNKVYQQGLFERIVPLLGAYEVVSHYQEQYPIYIATNGVSEVASYKLQKIGLDSFIQSIFSADMTKNTVTKAKKEFWFEFLEYLKKYQATDCLVIGDNYRDDVLTPKSLGFHTCFVHEGDLTNFIGDYQIDNLKCLKRIL